MDHSRPAVAAVSVFAEQASAIGKNMTNAKTFLEKRYSDDMGLEDAVHTALLTLKEGFEGQVSGSNIEVGGCSWSCLVMQGIPLRFSGLLGPFEPQNRLK